MCLRCREFGLLMAGLLLLSACQREERRFSEPAPASSVSSAISLSELQAGGSSPLLPSAIGRPYEYNAFAMSEGKRLFDWFNCSGCHAHGGGAIGPPLMDDQWIYGSEPENIFATIIQGRPNGMPAFRGRIPDQQVWQLVAYVRSMSGQVPKDAAPTRSDDMQVTASEQAAQKHEPKPSSTPPSSER
jgi:cytochrome c oxidase cbb3-type subunit III